MKSTLALTLFQTTDRILLRNILLIVAGSLLLTISSKIQIPFYPVPITMQTFVVLSLGIAYGWKLGTSTILFYLFQGAIGLPVFAGSLTEGGGFHHLIGPTGGYLLGFVFATFLTGWLAEKGWDKNFFLVFLTMVFGNIVIYLPGVIWLGSILGWDKPILQWGLYNFILGDLLKIALATGIFPTVWKLLAKK